MADLSNTYILPQIAPQARSLARGLVFAGYPSGKLYGKTIKDLSGYGYNVNYVAAVHAGADATIDPRLGPVFQTGSSSKRYRGAVNEPAQQSGGEWTLMSWVKPNTLSQGSDAYFLTYRNFSNHFPLNLLMTNTTGLASLVIVGASDTPTKQVTGSRGMTAGKWHHACGVYIPSTRIDVYLDGTLDATNSTSIPSAAGTWSDIAWNIGGPQSDSFSFNGWMAHVYVWNRALTAGEVRQFYDDPWVLFRHSLTLGKVPATPTTSPFYFNRFIASRRAG